MRSNPATELEVTEQVASPLAVAVGFRPGGGRFPGLGRGSC